MARGMGKETSPVTLVAGWFMLLGIAFIFKMLPLILLVCAIHYYCKAWKKQTESLKCEYETEPITFNFDEYVPKEAVVDVPESAVPNHIVEDAVSVLVNLRTNKTLAREAVEMAVENGATTIEEIIKQSLQSLNTR